MSVFRKKYAKEPCIEEAVNLPVNRKILRSVLPIGYCPKTQANDTIKS